MQEHSSAPAAGRAPCAMPPHAMPQPCYSHALWRYLRASCGLVQISKCSGLSLFYEEIYSFFFFLIFRVQFLLLKHRLTYFVTCVPSHKTTVLVSESHITGQKGGRVWAAVGISILLLGSLDMQVSSLKGFQCLSWLFKQHDVPAQSWMSRTQIQISKDTQPSNM